MLDGGCNLWQHETHPGYNGLWIKHLPFLSREQNVHAERLRQCKALFRGQHREYFLGEARTQFQYETMLVGGREIIPYVPLKMLRLMSVKSADLVFGEKAQLTVDDTLKQDALDGLIRRSKVHSRLHAACVQASWAGGAFLLSCLQRDQAWLCVVPPDEIFPVGLLGPDDQYEAYEQYRVGQVGPADDPIKLLLKITYTPGTIERRCFQLAADWSILREIDLSQWPGPEASLAPRQSTGLRDNLITYIPNEADDVQGLSDYDGLVSSQDAINASMTQIALVIAKHTNPGIAVPSRLFDQQGNLRSDMKVFPMGQDGNKPEYIVWDAQMSAALEDRKFRLNAFCIESEMSQVLLGIKEGAAPDAARKLRLEATNALAKAKRKSMNIEPAIQRSLEITLMLDASRPTMFALGGAPVAVEMRDGLPIDDLDEAQVVATYRAARAMSLEDSVERRVRDPKAKAVEVARIRAENQEAMPSLFGGGIGETNEAPTDTETTNQSAATQPADAEAA